MQIAKSECKFVNNKSAPVPESVHETCAIANMDGAGGGQGCRQHQQQPEQQQQQHPEHRPHRHHHRSHRHKHRHHRTGDSISSGDGNGGAIVMRADAADALTPAAPAEVDLATAPLLLLCRLRSQLPVQGSFHSIAKKRVVQRKRRDARADTRYFTLYVSSLGLPDATYLFPCVSLMYPGADGLMDNTITNLRLSW
jgi:hypothetical protein